MSMNVEKGFLSPPDICRGTDLWMLNDRLVPEELDRQIGDMKAKGFYSFIARTYVGLKSDYPGAGWKANIRTIVESARRHDMRVFLQAGYMPGSVYGLPTEYALEVVRVFKSGDEYEFEGKPSPGKLLKRQNGWDYVLCKADIFLDMFNVDACKYYVQESYEEMWKEFRADYGKTIISVWVDEPYFHHSSLPWTRNLEELFENRYHYSLSENVDLLYHDQGNYHTVRYHYRELMTELFGQAYFTQVRKWCRENGLLFSGHLMSEDTMESQISRTMACMPFYKYFDIPGIDLLFAALDWHDNPIPSRYPEYTFRPSLYNTPIQCVSAAHQAGKTEILAEMYGCISQDLNFRDQKHMFDHFAALGINHKMAHAVFYSLRGRAKRAYPPHINYYQPYWEHYHHVTDYCARASWFIKRGNPARDILVLHPLGSAFTEIRGPIEGHEQSKALRERDAQFTRLLTNLLSEQCSFDLGDEETIGTEASIAHDGRFNIGSMSYRIVVMPYMKVIKSTTLSLLEKFGASGGLIFALGNLPEMLDGIFDNTLKGRLKCIKGLRVIDRPAELFRRLRDFASYYIVMSSQKCDLIVNHRTEPDKHFFFLFNRNCGRSAEGVLRIAGTYGAQQWHGENGSITPLCAMHTENMTEVRFSIEAGGALMMVLDELEAAVPYQGVLPISCLKLNNAWQVNRTMPNVLVLEYARMKREEGEYSKLYPVMAIHDILIQEDYRGPLTLKFAFKRAQKVRNLSIALENPEMFSIMLNGKHINIPAARSFYVDRSFEIVPLPCSSLVPGMNIIELHCDYTPLEQPKADGAFSLFHDFKGVELECIYLLGDFAVETQREATMANTIRLDREMSLIPEVGIVSNELTDSGYPFYAGTFVLKQNFTVNIIPKNPTIVIKGFRGCVAKVTLNGTLLGKVGWAPYVVSAQNALVAGKNELTIELTNTLRNLLGPYHRPKGEYGTCFPGYNHPNLPWVGERDEETGEIIPNWQDNRENDTNAWTDSYMLVSQGLDAVYLCGKPIE